MKTRDFQNPTYLTKSRHGIFYFQVRIPEAIRHNAGIPQRLFRRSLGTRCHREALKLARKWWVQLEDKYDKLVKIRPAIISFRESIGQHGDSAKVSFMRSYLKDLDDDADLLREFMSHLLADEV
ncbi:MAG: DUF6538 domain-containing protein [Halioglobus sp.]